MRNQKKCAKLKKNVRNFIILNKYSNISPSKLEGDAESGHEVDAGLGEVAVEGLVGVVVVVAIDPGVVFVLHVEDVEEDE